MFSFRVVRAEVITAGMTIKEREYEKAPVSTVFLDGPVFDLAFGNRLIPH